ncbi:MAG TPA: hypothetical protein VHZ25_19445 [Acidobacteriaceae bacterium]|jgi:hypothetical protein|nr:hypothetical protein [Acidobacteriaceae bacterium]
MKGFWKLSVVLTLLVAPLFAAKTSPTVTISQSVTVGSTQIPSGDYRVSWDGTGPVVKVTLAASGKAPILLDAKLVQGQDGAGGVLVAVENGVRVLQEIQLKSASLVFGAPSATVQ